MKYLCYTLILFCFSAMKAQERKSVNAKPANSAISIDGVLNEPIYSDILPAKDFVQLQPYNGKPSLQPSEVYFFYDHGAIYVGAMLYDSSPDSIYNFLSQRDNIGTSDYFGVYFDPYNQGQLAYGFFVTPAGVQLDLKAIKSDNDYEDTSWDAVWMSKTRITDKGWVVEMRIPFSALRFPENGNGIWGLNMFRNIRRYNSNNSWSFVNREVSGFIHQQGSLSGMIDIKPPVRLSLTPYAAGYCEIKAKDSSRDLKYKGGMDLKYGISESFTLDMMLIPDFGQIQSDDQQLNLTPYELFYSERRQFFTEGTELFNRAGIFYSRRIGAQPKFANRATESLVENETITYNPAETQLLNATKISGRTAHGLGLGLLNAMTLPSFAIISDTLTGVKRKMEIQPFTNYNILVVDKSLKNNSYISFINSNLMMANDPFSANVTAADFQLRNKAKSFAIKGKGGLSYRKNGDNETGYFAELGLSKNSGKLQYGISQMLNSDKYNPNDLGFLYRNNEANTRTYIDYNILEPVGIIREWHSSVWWNHSRVYKQFRIAGNELALNSFGLFKNNHWTQFRINYYGNNYNYYEPRVSGRFYHEPDRINYCLFYWTNQVKPVSLHAGISDTHYLTTDQHANWGIVNVNVRLGRRYTLSYDTQFGNENNSRGFAGMNANEDTIYFTRRNIRNISNVINSAFMLSNNASFNVRVRHYWSAVINKDYFRLKPDGDLVAAPLYARQNNENYNAINVDFTFRWIFLPGSELSIAWKNAILDCQNEVTASYWENLGNTWKSNQTNSFSVKLIYYFDYNMLRKNKSLTSIS